MWHEVLRWVLVGGGLIAAAVVGFFLARRYRGSYRDALASRAEYLQLKASQAAQTTSEASASVSGHVVVVQQGGSGDRGAAAAGGWINHGDFPWKGRGEQTLATPRAG